jgi:hypothetical protein
MDQKDAFIELNNKKKALKLAYDKLTKEISQQIKKLKTDIMFRDLKGKNLVIVLGVDQFNVIFDVSDSLGDLCDLDFSEHDCFEIKDEFNLKIWGIPIYVDAESDNLVKVVVSASCVFNRFSGGLSYKGDKRYSKEVFNNRQINDRLEKYVSDLPDSAKFRKVFKEELK